MDKPKNWMFDVDARELENYCGPKSNIEEVFEDYAIYSLACFLLSLEIVGVAAFFYFYFPG